MKKYKKKYTTDNRVDMSKGGRVSKRIGGTLDKRERELEGTTNIPEQPPVSKNKVEPDEITSIERIPNEADLERERLAEERKRAAEEAAKEAAEEEAAAQAAQAASPEIMRETTPPGTTFTTTNQQGQTVNLPNMLDWEKQWLLENPKPPAGGKAAGAKA